MPIFLVWHDPDGRIDAPIAFALDRFELGPGLMLVDSALSRSKLYHRVKRALPPGTSLLVAPLAEAPKFKGMEAGALSWLRRRQNGFGTGDDSS